MLIIAETKTPLQTDAFFSPIYPTSCFAESGVFRLCQGIGEFNFYTNRQVLNFAQSVR